MAISQKSDFVFAEPYDLMYAITMQFSITNSFSPRLNTLLQYAVYYAMTFVLIPVMLIAFRVSYHGIVSIILLIYYS